MKPMPAKPSAHVEGCCPLRPKKSRACRRDVAAGPGSRRGLISFVSDRPGHDRRYAIDASKLELGRPRRILKPGFAKTVRSYIDQQPWWWASSIEGIVRTGWDRPGQHDRTWSVVSRCVVRRFRIRNHRLGIDRSIGLGPNPVFKRLRISTTARHRKRVQSSNCGSTRKIECPLALPFDQSTPSKRMRSASSAPPVDLWPSRGRTCQSRSCGRQRSRNIKR